MKPTGTFYLNVIDDSDITIRIFEFMEIATIKVMFKLHDSISFEYGRYSTAIVGNETNITMVYRLDEMGREKSSYQDLSGISDISKITETTRSEISGYSSVSDYYADLKIVKYKSLSVSLNNDICILSTLTGTVF